MQLYILIGIAHEERDLVAHFGPAYDDYRGRVGMLTRESVGADAPHRLIVRKRSWCG